MPKFLIETEDGGRYEVEAVDEASALAGIQAQLAGAPAPSNQQRYESALEQVRKSQFPDMTPEQWADYSSTIFAPQGFQGIAQQGQLFGLTDEIGAGLGALGSQVRNWMGDANAPGFGEAFGQYSELEQARRDLGREAMGEPLSLGAEVLGGASIFAPASGVASSLSAVVPSRLQTVAAGLGTGGALGAAYGFGSTDGGLGERGVGALVGAGTGAAVGAVAPYIADAGVGIYGALTNNAARRVAAAQMGVSPEAAQIVRQITAFDNSLGPSGAANLQAAGRERMLLDAGPNAQSAADYLMRRPGQAGGVISEALSNRASRDAGELQNALNLYLGDPQGVATLRRNIATASASERDAAYRAAYDAPIDYSSDTGRVLQDIITNRVDQSDINAANALMRAEGVPPSRHIMATVADDGTVTYMRLPGVQEIDYITRALNDRAAANAGLGAMGGQTNQGRVYSGLSRDLRGSTRDAVPEYATALETAADPIRRSQATQLGYDMLGPGTPRDVAADAIAGMTAPEREAVALGIRSRIDENLANVSRAVSTGREDEVSQALRAMRDLTSPGNRQKVALAIGDEDAALLFEEVDRIFISLQREALRRTGSQTAGRLYAQETFDPAINPQDIFTTLGQGKPLNATQRVIQSLTGLTPERQAARADQIGMDVARLLVAQGDDLSRNISALGTYNRSALGSDAVANALRRRINAAGGALTYPAAVLQSNRQR